MSRIKKQQGLFGRTDFYKDGELIGWSENGVFGETLFFNSSGEKELVSEQGIFSDNIFHDADGGYAGCEDNGIFTDADGGYLGRSFGDDIIIEDNYWG